MVGRRVLGVTTDALKHLEAYPFPGNVRELETEVQRMVAVAEQGGYIALRHLSEKISSTPINEAGPGGFVPTGGTLKDMVESLERAIVHQALDRSHWNQSKVATDLGLSRVGLANKIPAVRYQAGTCRMTEQPERPVVLPFPARAPARPRPLPNHAILA